MVLPCDDASRQRITSASAGQLAGEIRRPPLHNQVFQGADSNILSDGAMGTGFFVGRQLGMYPIESAIVNACHSGQNGTGDIAVLTAANGMQLMPLAQIATRISGAITVTLTLILLARLG
jgi:2-hydroxycarboxylate transporter family